MPMVGYQDQYQSWRRSAPPEPQLALTHSFCRIGANRIVRTIGDNGHVAMIGWNRMTVARHIVVFQMTKVRTVTAVTAKHMTLPCPSGC